MPIAPVLQRFIDDELSASQLLIERTLAGTLLKLGDARDPVARSIDRGVCAALLDAVRRHAGAFASAFLASLREDFRRHLGALDAGRGAADIAPRAAGLELMDESLVEVDIEISRAIQLIDTAAEWELRELQTFTSTLMGQTHVSPESNPLQPRVYVTALWEAAVAVTPNPPQRLALLRVSASAIAGLLKSTWAAASTRLEAQGIEPGIYRTVVLTPANAGGRGAAASPDPDSGLHDLLARLPVPADPSTAPVQPAPTAVPRADAATGFESALRRLEALWRHAPPESGAGAAAEQARRLEHQRAVLVASAGGAVSRQAIELLSRLFETALSDARLNPALRPIVARLQASSLRLALSDPTLVQQRGHPVWRLLDRLDQASAGWPRVDDPRSVALLALGESLAERLASAPSPDAALFDQALATLDAFLAERLRDEQAAAAPIAEDLARTEARNALEHQLAQRLADELAAVRTSAALRRFVTGAWARVLAEAIQRFGEDAEPTATYLKTVDDLLWTLQLPDHPQSRQRLVALLPGLLQRLRAGMASIALPEAEQRSVLDELMAIHTEALRPGARGAAGSAAQNATDRAASEPTSSEMAADIVQRLRDETAPTNAAFAATGPGALIDVASLETVPAALLPEPPAAVADTARQVDALDPGARCRLFLKGRWTHAQLLWRSPRGEMLLLAGEHPERPHSVTRRALQRLNEAGLAELAGPPPLVQRSIDTLTRRITPR